MAKCLAALAVLALGLPSQDPVYPGTVAIWYALQQGRDWRNIEEFKGPYHPAIGNYTTEDPKVVERHLHDIRRAGADLIIFDGFSTNKNELRGMPEDKTLANLVEALSHQEKESRKLKLCIWLEKYDSDPSYEDMVFALDYVRRNLAGKDFYFQYKGKPLVVVYTNRKTADVERLEAETKDFTLRRIRAYSKNGWSYISYSPQPLHAECMPASPGIDPFLENAYMAKYLKGEDPPDLARIRKEAKAADRKDGKFYRAQLERARDAKPEMIFLSGWNDWQYGNQIEPSVEYGYTYVDLTAEVLGRVAETAPYRKD